VFTPTSFFFFLAALVIGKNHLLRARSRCRPIDRASRRLQMMRPQMRVTLQSTRNYIKAADYQSTCLLSHRHCATSTKMRFRRDLQIRLQLPVLVAMVTDAVRQDNYTAPSVIKIGLLQPLEGPLGFERTGSAATMAVRDAQRRGYLNQTHVEYKSICNFGYAFSHET